MKSLTSISAPAAAALAAWMSSTGCRKPLIFCCWCLSSFSLTCSTVLLSECSPFPTSQAPQSSRPWRFLQHEHTQDTYRLSAARLSSVRH